MRSGKPERRHDAGKAVDSVTDEVFIENESLASCTIHLERQFKFPCLHSVAPFESWWGFAASVR